MQRIIDKVKIDHNGCWIWQGSIANNGYGNIKYKGKRWNTHRVSYIEFVGDIPEGLFVLHKCDVRACCNPEHLWLGTQKDNMHDASLKGRIVSTETRKRAPIKHGTEYKYKKGCRCELCKSNYKIVRHKHWLSTGK